MGLSRNSLRASSRSMPGVSKVRISVASLDISTRGLFSRGTLRMLSVERTRSKRASSLLMDFKSASTSSDIKSLKGA